MGKNKKPKKKSSGENLGGYKRFLKEIHRVWELLDVKVNLKDTPSEYKRMMYDFNLKIRCPIAGNDEISAKELRMIDDKTRTYYRTPNYTFQNKKISCYQLQILYCYSKIKAVEIEKRMGDKDDPVAINFRESAKGLQDTFYGFYLVDYIKILIQLSNPDQKYFYALIKPAPVLKEYPSWELTATIYGYPARKFMIEVNGHVRPAFQLGKIQLGETPEWISLDRSIFNGVYKGNKHELDVFIQSHALRRLKERLDLLDQEAVNYAIWENTRKIVSFDNYRGYLLLPFKVFDIKIGYLAAKIVGDKVLLRTFLFITHSCTPEGDRLKKLTGLCKQDINYWRIDRLSTFVKLDAKKYPELIRLFSDAGLGELMQLKEKEFTIDTMQMADLEGLIDYINKSREVWK